MVSIAWIMQFISISVLSISSVEFSLDFFSFIIQTFDYCIIKQIHSYHLPWKSAKPLFLMSKQLQNKTFPGAQEVWTMLGISYFMVLPMLKNWKFDLSPVYYCCFWDRFKWPKGLDIFLKVIITCHFCSDRTLIRELVDILYLLSDYLYVANKMVELFL